MKNVSFILLAFVSLLFTSCEDNLFNRNCLTDEGDMVTRTIEVDDFTGIALDFPAEVVLTQAATQKVEIRSTDNIIDKIVEDSKVEGGMWVVNIDENCVNIDNELKIFVSLPNLTALDVFSAAEIETNGAFKDLDNLSISVEGASTMDLTLENLNNLTVQTKAATNLSLTGDVNTALMELNGATDINAFDFAIQKLELDATGAIDAEIKVEDELIISLAGAADVCYRGNPTITQQIEGAAEFKDCN